MNWRRIVTCSIVGFACGMGVLSDVAVARDMQVGLYYPTTIATVASSTGGVASIWSGFGLGLDVSGEVFEQGWVRLSYEGNYGVVSRSILFTGLHAGFGYSLFGHRSRTNTFPGGEIVFAFQPVLSIYGGVFHRKYDFSHYLSNSGDAWSMSDEGSFTGLFCGLETVWSINGWSELGATLRFEQAVAGPPQMDFRLISGLVRIGLQL